MPKTIALIPARYGATRLPGKLMKVLSGKTIIRRTYESVKNTGLFDDVFVVCDDERILTEIQAAGGKALMSIREHESGTDRIAEVAADIDADIIVNVQGDEPFIDAGALEDLLRLFENEEVQVGSLRLPIDAPERIQDPNCVKVVCDRHGKALLFSRAAIPFVRDTEAPVQYYQHIGVYAFRKQALMTFTQLPVSSLEAVEKLENLRLLENGIPIHLAIVSHVGLSIDTQADFDKAEKWLADLSTENNL
jgi:3-deoxy-manno-octulosonate cytidylyltransferase (CMP-KDO synthetase)